MHMRNSWIKRLSAILAGLVLLGLGVAFMQPYVAARSALARERSHAIELLQDASTVEELNDAVGYLGLFQPISDHDWIAIRYKDMHVSPGFWSYATALDSEGHWYVSTYHHCGRFQSYRKAVELIDNEPDPVFKSHYERRLESFPNLVELADCNTLSEARRILSRLHFEQDDTIGK